jgi:hypothetical protein
MLENIWTYQPVQKAVMSLLAGSVIATVVIGVRTASSYFESKTTPADALIAGAPSLEAGARELEASDPDFIEIFGRLLPFRRFQPEAFDAIVDAARSATSARAKEYEIDLTAAASARVRAAYQGIIEATRLFRAHLELIIASALEDFDEVAVDIQAKVEQMCQDAIQDTFK